MKCDYCGKKIKKKHKKYKIDKHPATQYVCNGKKYGNSYDSVYCSPACIGKQIAVAIEHYEGTK